MKDGDFVLIDYVGKVKDTGEIFDLTREDVAREKKVYDPKVRYSPVSVIVGSGFVIKGLDGALREMNNGEKKTVEIDQKDAFGERSGSLIKLIQVSVFREQNIDPNPGSYVNINGINGRVVSADGGRIRVDFNHPLAGKTLEYEIEVKKEITALDEKVKSVVTYFSGIEKEFSVSVVEKNAEVKLDSGVELNKEVRKSITDAVFKWLKEIDKLKFVQEFSR